MQKSINDITRNKPKISQENYIRCTFKEKKTKNTTKYQIRLLRQNKFILQATVHSNQHTKYKNFKNYDYPDMCTYHIPLIFRWPRTQISSLIILPIYINSCAESLKIRNRNFKVWTNRLTILLGIIVTNLQFLKNVYIQGKNLKIAQNPRLDY